jgi:RHS repeat-associated protein
VTGVDSGAYYVDGVQSPTDSTGAVIGGGRLYYDAWGKMRNANGSADTTCAQPTQAQSDTGTTRGFTAQEQMPAFCLVNYNARLYDPTLGRFMAPDPTTEAVYNLQDLNRYSYVLNNPLSLNDPTGYGGLFGHNALLNEIAGIALAVILQQTEFLPWLLTSLSVPSAFVTPTAIGLSGGLSGAVSTGTLKGALIGAAEAEGFNAAGDLVGASKSSSILSAHTAEVFVAHGIVGGLASWAGGSKFGSGFLAAGFGSLADDPAFDTGNKWSATRLSMLWQAASARFSVAASLQTERRQARLGICLTP